MHNVTADGHSGQGLAASPRPSSVRRGGPRRCAAVVAGAAPRVSSPSLLAVDREKSWTSIVATTAWSCCSAPSRVHRDGCWCPMLLAKAWFQSSQTWFVLSVPSTVAPYWFQHIAGGNVGGVRLSWSSSLGIHVSVKQNLLPPFTAFNHFHNICFR